MIVVGSAGTGKTTLAQEYARSARPRYDEILTIKRGTLLNTHALLPYVAAQLGWKFSTGTFPSDTDLSSHYQIHRVPLIPSPRQRVLVLIDGLDEFGFTPREVVDLIFHLSTSSQGGTVKWLITARTNYLSHIVDTAPHYAHLTNVTHIGGFSESEIELFLQRRLRGRIPSRQLELLTRIGSQRLSGNPYYVEMLAASLSASDDLDVAISNLDLHLQQGLTNLILSPARNRIAAIPSSLLAAQEFVSPTGLLVRAAPYISIPRFSLYWRSQLDHFEALINNPASRERDFQAFFEEHPHFLQGIEYQRVIPHPILERGIGQGSLVPDFFLQPVGSSYVDILDLKLPTQTLVVGRENRMRFSAAIHEALAQVREYQDYFEDPRHRRTVADRYGITAYRPSAAVIVGRTPDSIDEEKLRAIRDTLPRHSRVITYDELLLRMNRMADVYSI